MLLQRLHCASWLLVLAWMPVQALEVSAKISGGAVRWISAQSDHGDLVTSVWETPSQLVPASDFIPGAAIVGTLQVNFVGGKAGSRVPLMLSLRGMEYNSPDITSNLSDASGGTANTNVSAGGVVVVLGTGLGDKRIKLDRELSPFTHARPIFSLGSSDEIVQAFSNAGATQGTYTAQVQLPLMYDYVRNGVRIRHNWNMPLTINIEYTPSVLTDVILRSPTQGEMTPRYYTVGGVRKIQGEAVYSGTAVGMFVNGVRIRLATGDRYQMREVTATAMPASFPYSVTCDGCERSQLVFNGVAEPGMTTVGTRMAGANVHSIPFSIRVNFIDILLSSLQTGTYRDQFTLLFEPDV